MMEDRITINIADMRLARSPAVFVTFALGSCVGICLYDAVEKVGGLGHIMLPCRPKEDPGRQVFRYADSCIPEMVKGMERMGCPRCRIVAKITGGAKMFQIAGDGGFGNIGERNLEAVRNTLAELNIRVVSEDTGLNYGRTVYFYTETGTVLVKSFAKGVKRL
jgi:chemotaxis protein CheD